MKKIKRKDKTRKKERRDERIHQTRTGKWTL